MPAKNSPNLTEDSLQLKNKSHKPFIILISIFIFSFIVLVIGYIIIFSISNLSPSQTQEPYSPSPSLSHSKSEKKINYPIPTPTDILSWKTFTSDEYQFSFKYPPSWKVKDISQIPERFLSKPFSNQGMMLSSKVQTEEEVNSYIDYLENSKMLSLKNSLRGWILTDVNNPNLLIHIHAVPNSSHGADSGIEGEIEDDSRWIVSNPKRNDPQFNDYHFWRGDYVHEDASLMFQAPEYRIFSKLININTHTLTGISEFNQIVNSMKTTPDPYTYAPASLAGLPHFPKEYKWIITENFIYDNALINQSNYSAYPVEGNLFTLSNQDLSTLEKIMQDILYNLTESVISTSITFNENQYHLNLENDQNLQTSGHIYLNNENNDTTVYILALKNQCISAEQCNYTLEIFVSHHTPIQNILN